MTETRLCLYCECDLPLSAFGPRVNHGKPGLQSYCRPCMVLYHALWRATKGAEKWSLGSAASRARYPERYQARRRLRDAVRHGKLLRGPCAYAGEECKGDIHGHHDDYTKPLEVVWVCRKHHALLDRARRAA